MRQPIRVRLWPWRQFAIAMGLILVGGILWLIGEAGVFLPDGPVPYTSLVVIGPLVGIVAVLWILVMLAAWRWP